MARILDQEHKIQYSAVALQPGSELQDALPAQPTRAGLAYQMLRMWIVEGRLAPGQKLDQASLSQLLGVSRTPLRQALSRLKSEGLVSQQAYQGATVSPLELDSVVDIYRSRIVLEVMLAGEAARVPEESVAAELHGLLAEQDAVVAAADISSFVSLDQRFHLRLYAATGFTHACDIMARLFSLSERYRRAYANLHAAPSRSLEEHRGILQAYVAGDSDAAKSLTEQHIRRGLDSLISIIDRDVVGTSGTLV
jgi:DNA-binding GntR family transcriptional regulator